MMYTRMLQELQGNCTAFLTIVIMAGIMGTPSFQSTNFKFQKATYCFTVIHLYRQLLK